MFRRKKVIIITVFVVVFLVASALIYQNYVAQKALQRLIALENDTYSEELASSQHDEETEKSKDPNCRYNPRLAKPTQNLVVRLWIAHNDPNGGVVSLEDFLAFAKDDIPPHALEQIKKRSAMTVRKTSQNRGFLENSGAAISFDVTVNGASYEVTVPTRLKVAYETTPKKCSLEIYRPTIQGCKPVLFWSVCTGVKEINASMTYVKVTFTKLISPICVTFVRKK